jgi:hypothetical protein
MENAISASRPKHRPAHLGSMYFERSSEQIPVRKYFVGYSENGKKIGLDPEEMEEFLSNSCFSIAGFIKRVFHAKVLIP